MPEGYLKNKKYSQIEIVISKKEKLLYILYRMSLLFKKFLQVNFICQLAYLLDER